MTQAYILYHFTDPLLGNPFFDIEVRNNIDVSLMTGFGIISFHRDSPAAQRCVGTTPIAQLCKGPSH
jgi:hypothetical protein